MLGSPGCQSLSLCHTYTSARFPTLAQPGSRKQNNSVYISHIPHTRTPAHTLPPTFFPISLLVFVALHTFRGRTAAAGNRTHVCATNKQRKQANKQTNTPRTAPKTGEQQQQKAQQCNACKFLEKYTNSASRGGIISCGRRRIHRILVAALKCRLTYLIFLPFSNTFLRVFFPLFLLFFPFC